MEVDACVSAGSELADIASRYVCFDHCAPPPPCAQHARPRGTACARLSVCVHVCRQLASMHELLDPLVARVEASVRCAPAAGAEASSSSSADAGTDAACEDGLINEQQLLDAEADFSEAKHALIDLQTRRSLAASLAASNPFAALHHNVEAAGTCTARRFTQNPANAYLRGAALVCERGQRVLGHLFARHAAELAHARMKADVTATKQRVEGVRTDLAQLTQSVAAQSVALHATQSELHAALQELQAALLDASAPASLHMDTPTGTVTLTDENSARELLGIQVCVSCLCCSCTACIAAVHVRGWAGRHGA